MNVACPISFGEFIDKYTIVLIKLEKVKDESKLENIRREFLAINTVYEKLPPCQHLVAMKFLNNQIWDVENIIRKYATDNYIGAEFIAGAKKTIILNDERAQLKKKIDLEYGSELIWEKEHA